MTKLKKRLIKLQKQKNTIDREKLVYKASEYTCDFRNFRTIRTFGINIHNGEITLEEADEDQSKLVDEIEIFNNKTRPQNANKKKKKELFLKTCINFMMQEKKFIMDLIAKYF